MARIAGGSPRDKRLDIALRYTYGIGPTRAYEIVSGSGVEGGTKVRDLSEDEVLKIRAYIDQNLKVEETSAARWHRTSSARSRSAATKASVTAVRLRPRAAHAYERAHPQGPEEDDRGSEEGTGEEVAPRNEESEGIDGEAQGEEGTAAGEEERRPRPGAHQVHVQQHDRHHHGSPGQHARGRAPATWASRDPASPPCSPRSWPPRRQPARLKSTASRRSTCS